MPIRTVKITAEQREELIQLCRQYSDLQKKAVEIRCALNDQVAALAGLVESGEVAGLSTDFSQIEVVSVAEWNEGIAKRNGFRAVGMHWLLSHKNVSGVPYGPSLIRKLGSLSESQDVH